jgi:hypothetical protein
VLDADDGPVRRRVRRCPAEVERDCVDRVIQEVEQHHDFTLSTRQKGERHADIDRVSNRCAQIVVSLRRAHRDAVACESLGASPAETVARNVERHDTDPRTQDIDRSTPREAFAGASASLIDGVASPLRVSRHEPKRADQPRIFEDEEVFEPSIVQTAFTHFHNRHDA